MADTAAISTPVKAGAAGVVVGGLAAIGYAFRREPTTLVVIAVGAVAVVGLLLLYKWILGRREAARAASMGEDLKAGGKRKPREISSPQALANLSDLQSKFDEGVEKFRSAGKNLYSLPWYLLIGEPGSGKTEAIRHCNVGFPAGLQEEQQGVGGTVNMNWWFTNYAVILDTAGRLVFDGVEAGSTAEWREFLKLLAKARPNCPVNGLLLVIPADSLIIDTADKIDAKAGKIAQQLDTVQRTLGVRFPVFVVVTKSDRINGFREFFDNMDDPRLQHQMLGWSNPDPLDAPFNPELVEAHLASVEQRLGRRRLGLLLDPVHSENPNGRRLDQVDALYAFPESLTVVGPRLRRYLEQIFTAGEWSPKPLFLRGIYFTSSMREGSALDKDVADLLGVPVESLPEGRVWEQDRAYFLRDVFTAKVFREKGLVTRAGNTKRVRTRRQMAVLGSGIAAVVVLTVMTIYGSNQLEQRVGKQSQYWQALRETYANDDPDAELDLLTPGPTPGYQGDKPIRFGDFYGDPHRRRAFVLADAVNWVGKDVDVPAAFAWTKVVPAFDKTKQVLTYRAVFERKVIDPLVAAVCDRLGAERDRLAADRNAALDGATADRKADLTVAAVEQLLAIEGSAAAKPGQRRTPVLKPLFDYLLDGNPTQAAYDGHDADGLQAACDRLYKPEEKWSFQFRRPGSTAKGVGAGVEWLAKYWDGQFGDADARRITVQLTSHLEAIAKADADVEKRFVKDPPPSFGSGAGRQPFADDVAAIKDAAAKADDCVAEIDRRRAKNPTVWSDPTSLVALYRADRAETAKRVAEQVKAVRRDLREVAPDNASEDGPFHDATAALAGVRADGPAPAGGTASDVPATVVSLDDGYFKPVGAGVPKRYAAIGQAYAAVSQGLPSADATGPAGESGSKKLETISGKVTGFVATADKAVTAASALVKGDAHYTDVFRAVVKQLGLAVAIDAVMVDLTGLDTAGRVAAAVAAGATDGTAGDVPPPLPMTAVAGAAANAVSYDPARAGPMFARWAAIRDAAAGAAADGKVPPAYGPQDRAVAAYADDYVRYWSEAIPTAAHDVPALTWGPALQSAFPADDAVDAIRKTADAVVAAMSAVPKSIGSAATAALKEQTSSRIGPASDLSADDRRTLDAVGDQWRQLVGTADAARARAKLATGGPAAVANNYLVRLKGAGPYAAYWQFVTRSSMTSLAKEPGSVAADVAAKLSDPKVDARFPFARPAAGPTLTADQVKAVAADVQQFKAAAGFDVAAVPRASEDAGWFPAALGRIVNGKADAGPPYPVPDQVRFTEAMLGVVTGDPLVCRAFTLDFKTQVKAIPPGKQLATDGEKIQFALGYKGPQLPSGLGGHWPAVVPAGGVANENDFTTSNGPPSTEPAIFVFTANPRGTAFAGPWACVRVLFDTHAMPYGPVSANGTAKDWLVPVPVTDANGGPTGRVVVVRFTFNRDVPAIP